tara:strand:+ start:27 stop:287 length:261 start_codon:yes stop_codon:yes gene_type:complete
MLIHNNFINMLFLLRLVFRWLRTLPQTTLHKNAYYKGVVHKAMKTILLIIFLFSSAIQVKNLVLHSIDGHLFVFLGHLPESEKHDI